MRKRRRLRQALQPRRDPGAVLLREFPASLAGCRAAESSARPRAMPRRCAACSAAPAGGGGRARDRSTCRWTMSIAGGSVGRRYSSARSDMAAGPPRKRPRRKYWHTGKCARHARHEIKGLPQGAGAVVATRYNSLWRGGGESAPAAPPQAAADYGSAGGSRPAWKNTALEQGFERFAPARSATRQAGNPDATGLCPRTPPVSRAQRALKWCAADPGPVSTPKTGSNGWINRGPGLRCTANALRRVRDTCISTSE